jgi:hypothetical protein
MSSQLRGMFEAVESQMRSKLEQARATFAHPGNKGDECEDSARSFLRMYLPRRLAVGHGEVIDQAGHRSGQVDILIANEDQPFTFSDGERGLFMVEGIAAAGEVKARLTTHELQRTIDAGIAFKRLKNDHPNGTMTHTNPSALERFYVCPPFFGLAYESNVAIPTIIQRLNDAHVSNSPTSTPPVDAIFILGRGWAINFGDGQGALTFITPEGQHMRGWVWQNSAAVLVDLLSWLSAVMPRCVCFSSVVTPYLIKSWPQAKD